VVLFPEKINGRYARLDRPHSEISPWSIWISYSPDLIHWGDAKVVSKPMVYHWDEMKVGPGATPIINRQGLAKHLSWRVQDHGWGCLSARRSMICRTFPKYSQWLTSRFSSPRTHGKSAAMSISSYSAAVREDDGTLKIYWGGADSVMCAGTAWLERLVDLCLSNTRPAL
jgi:hypothetical protein